MTKDFGLFFLEAISIFNVLKINLCFLDND